MGRSGWSQLTPGATQGHQSPIDDYAALEVGQVLTVTAAGADVVLPAAPEHTFENCPWGLGAYDSAAAALTAGWHPRPGDTCLVVLAGEDHDPWVVSWWR